MTPLSPRRLRHACFWILGAVIALSWYLKGCELMWPTNEFWSEDASAKTYDQAYYIKLANQMSAEKTDNNTLLPRSRMPLYPWMLHLLQNDSLTETQQFDVYKRFNVTLSCLALAGIAWIASRWLGSMLGVTLAIITASTFFVFKAILVQPEILFYFCYFCLFLLMMRSLRRPGWKLGAGIGLLTAVTYFLKGSCLPMLVLFFVLSLLQGMLALWRRRGQKEARRAKIWLPLAAFTGCFLLLGSVHWYRSYQFYGLAWYEPNARYYFWAESPDEMMAMQELELSERKPTLTKKSLKHPGVKAFLESNWLPDPVLRARLQRDVRKKESVVLEGKWDILPGPRNWWKRHSLREGIDRIWNGFFDEELGVISRNASHRNGYFWYLVAFGIAAFAGVGLTTIFKRNELKAALRNNALPLTFAVLSIVGSLVLYAWWAQVSSRNRFFLTQYLPLMMLLGMVIRWTSRRLEWRDLKASFSEIRFPKWLGGAVLREPLLLVLMLAVWFELAQDLQRMGTLDKPFFKNNPNRSQAEANLVQ